MVLPIGADVNPVDMKMLGRATLGTGTRDGRRRSDNQLGPPWIEPGSRAYLPRIFLRQLFVPTRLFAPPLSHGGITLRDRSAPFTYSFIDRIVAFISDHLALFILLARLFTGQSDIDASDDTP